LTAGSFLTLYLPELALPMADPALRLRFESRRDANLAALYRRIEQVGVERTYRIVGLLEETGRMLENDVAPRVRRFLAGWRRLTLWADGAILAGLALLFLSATFYAGDWDGLVLRLPFWEALKEYPLIRAAVLAVLGGAAVYVHCRVRGWAAGRVARRLAAEAGTGDLQAGCLKAFRKNSRWYRSIFQRRPAGWNRRSRRGLARILEDTQDYFQKLNDQHTNPSGESAAPAGRAGGSAG
jgi:hypothetical protein